MSDKYGGAIDVSDAALTEDPALWAVVEERARRQAGLVGATDRFTFTKRECDGLFMCPRYFPCEEEHEHDDVCQAEVVFRPHWHTYWTGYTA